MNANELADELENLFPHIDVRDAATMLRQQEVEIERITSKYEEILHKQQEKLIKYELRHAEQRKRIEALEKEVKHWQDAFHKGVRL